MAEYPQIDPKSLAPLRVIAQELEADAGYLVAPDCPYEPELREFLALLGPPKVIEVPVSVPIEVDEGAVPAAESGFLGHKGSKWAAMEAESLAVYKDLKNFGAEIGPGDVTERMAFYRTLTALLEKLISINQRALGLKSIHEFQETMLQIFEEILDPGQRTEVMKRLRIVIDLKEATD